MRRFVPAVILAGVIILFAVLTPDRQEENGPGDARKPPSRPRVVPEWQRGIEKQLRATFSIEWTGGPAEGVIKWLHVAGDVNIVIDPAAKENLAREITLAYTDAEMAAVLDEVLRQAGLRREFRNHVIYVTTPGGGRETPPTDNEELARRLKERKGDLSVNRVPASELVRLLAHMAGAEVVFDPACLENDSPIVLGFSEMPLGTVLDRALPLTGWRRSSTDGTIYIAPAGKTPPPGAAGAGGAGGRGNETF